MIKELVNDSRTQNNLNKMAKSRPDKAVEIQLSSDETTNTSVLAGESFQDAAIDITPMTEEEARQCADAIKGNLESLRSMLLDLQRRRGWEALGYSSWRECATSEFGQSQAYVYRLVQAAEVEENLVSSQISTIVETDSIPINQLSELAKLPPEQQAEGLQKANELAIAERKPRTAAHVAKAVRSIKKPTSVALTEPTEVDIGSSSDEQYTPRKIIDAVLECFGRIALDPCSNSHTNPNVPADRHFTKEDNGLDQDWEEDNAYINPPYSDKEPWIVKTVEEYTSKRLPEAITLTPTDTSTYWFELIWEHASAVCFVNRRLKFINPANKSGARFASAVAYFGLDVQAFYKAFHGKIGRCAMPMFENAPTEAQWKASEEKRLELLEALRETLSEIQQLKNERDQAFSEVEALRQKLASQEESDDETDPKHLNRLQLAHCLGVSHTTIKRWEESGELEDKGWETIPGTIRPQLYREIGA